MDCYIASIVKQYTFSLKRSLFNHCNFSNIF